MKSVGIRKINRLVFLAQQEKSKITIFFFFPSSRVVLIQSEWDSCPHSFLFSISALKQKLAVQCLLLSNRALCSASIYRSLRFLFSSF